MALRMMMKLLVGGFLIIGEISAMEPEKKGPPKTEMTLSEKEHLQKMLLLKEHMIKEAPEVPYEVYGHIGETLHALSPKPVLDGTMEYTTPMMNIGKFSFQIGTKIKDDIIDFSDKSFGDLARYLVITIDPDKFFADHGEKVVVLIAPWSLIRDNLSSSCAPFQPIMAKWDHTKAPIGIFWRKGNLDKSWYKFNTKFSLSDITSNTMWKLIEDADILYVSEHDYRETLEYGARFQGENLKKMLLRIKLNFEQKQKN